MASEAMQFGLLCIVNSCMHLFYFLLAEMPGVARVEISKWSVPHHTISSLIALLRSFTRHRFRWSSSSKLDAFLKYGKQESKQSSKEIYPRNGPQRKYHPIVIVTNKKQT
jgi:hypothetical protein